jgi:hypothetical protein
MQETVKLKYNYITYATMGSEYSAGLGMDKLRAKMDEYKAHAEKHGFEMTYWGHPYGVSEDILMIFNSEKALGDWQKMNMAFGDLSISGQRTTLSARQ